LIARPENGKHNRECQINTVQVLHGTNPACRPASSQAHLDNHRVEENSNNNNNNKKSVVCNIAQILVRQIG